MSIKGYKGFDKDLKCRGFQYEQGKEYKHKGEVSCCDSGFHFVEGDPFDVFNYYPPAESRYCEVEGSGKTSKVDSKVSCSKINIGAEIGIVGLVKAKVEYVKSKIDWNNDDSTNTGYHAAATNTGYQSAATNTGDQSAATNTGDHSAATNTGNQSAATNTGYQSAATNTGYHSAATNTGDHSAATNTGYQSAATVEGKESVAISLGIEGKAKGSLGCWIVLSEWEQDDEWHRKLVKCFLVDGETIKPDVFYKLENGKAVEDK